MPSDRHELQQRIAAAREGDSIRGVFFNVLLQVAQERGGREGRERVLNPRRRDGYAELRSYPATEFLTLLFDLADLPPAGKTGGRAGATAEDVAAVFHACGAACVQRFASGAGQIVFGILGKADPHRLLTQAGMAYSTTVSYGQRTYQARGEKEGTLSYVGDMLPPDYHRGIIEEALRALGSPGRATARQLAIDRAEYDISWT